MSLTRRSVLGVTAGAAGLVASGLDRLAFAQSSPVRIGWLAALTGPSSATGVAMDRGVDFAIKEISAAGGVKERKLELVTRDTQSDPTKAVNAAAELAYGEKVDVIWGPVNSGEALAATPVIAKAGVPLIHPCWVDQLIDVAKYPYAFRLGPTNQQVGRAASRYAIEVLKMHEIALISDTTGYGTSSVQAFAPMIREIGGKIVYQAAIEASQPDLKPDMMRMRGAGAQVIMPWSVSAGFLARILNTRANLGWDVPVVGQTTLGSGQIKALLDKPSNWEKVYQVNFRSCSYDESGELPPRTADFAGRLRAAKVDVSDTLLWWIAVGNDAAHVVADAVRKAGSSAQAIVGYWNTLQDYPGVFGDHSFTPQQHNGLPDEAVVMSQANSFRDGAFKLAPGYGSA